MQDNEESVFAAAIDRKTPAERAAYLDIACAGKPQLRNAVESLLDAYPQGEFLESPNSGVVATVDMPPAAEKPGTQIGPYKLREQIGEGGFGVVYVAEQEKPVARKVALKIIKPGMDTREIIARFEAERQALALMDHPNIAKVLDAGTTSGNPKSESRNPKEIRSTKSQIPKRPDVGDLEIRNSDLELPSKFAAVEFEQGRDSNFRPEGRPYFVMELVRGVPITEFCDERKLNTRERLALFIDVCRAVQHAHQKGIIHRDIKPSNVMVTLRDDRPIPKVIDFGVSKALSSKLTEKTIYTAYGQMIGTPLYMSPEQAQLNEIDVDTRSDVYSLGVLLYELLTGTTPFDKETLQKSGFDEMRRIIREDEPPRPSARISTLRAEILSTVSDKRKIDPRKLGASLRGELDWIVMKALEKDRNRRYESANAFAADVERYLNDEPVLACPPSMLYQLRKFARRKRGLLTGLTVLSLSLLVAGGAIAGSIGWAVRDKEHRRNQLAERVELVLEEVEQYKNSQNWIAARQANKRAQTLLSDSTGHQELKDRIRRHQKELEFVAALRAVRENRGITAHPGGSAKKAKQDGQQYDKLFRNFGIDINALTVIAAAAVVKPHAAIQTAVATILDDWASNESQLLKNPDMAAKLWRLAIAIDSDEWRNNLRAALVRGDGETLKRLAESKDVLRQPPATLWLLGNNLAPRHGKAIDRDLGIDLLRKAAHRYPRDFWLNNTVGRLLMDVRQHKQAITYLNAAHVLRPRLYASHHNLATCLSIAGYHDAAIDQYRNLLRRHPRFWWPHYGIAYAYEQHGDYEQALKHFQVALNANPDEKRIPLIHGMIGVLHARLKRPKEAVEWYRKAIVGELSIRFSKPEDARTRLTNNLRNLLRAAGQAKTDVVPFLREIVEDHPDSAQARYHLALALHADSFFVIKSGELKWRPTNDPKRLRAAVAELRETVRQNRDYAKAWHTLGEILAFKLNQPDEAVKVFRQVIRRNHKTPETHIDIGRVYEQQGRLPDAIQEYRAAIDTDKDHARSWYHLGSALLRNKQHKEAVDALRQAITRNSRSATYFSTLGHAYLSQRKLVDALCEFRQALALHPTHYDALPGYARTLLRLGRPFSAVNAYRRALSAYPKRESIQAELADALQSEIRQSMTRRARINFKRVHLVLNDAVKLQPGYYGFWYLHGNVHRSQSKSNQAIACWREALKLKSDHAPTHHVLGRELIRTGRIPEGIRHLREAVRLNPRNPDYLAQLAVQLTNCADVRERQPAEGLKLASKVVALVPRHALTWQVLGWAKYRTGDYRGCVAALQKSMRLQPGGKGDAGQWLVLSMAHHQLGDKTLSQMHYNNSVRWIRQNKTDDPMIQQLQKEAVQLLGIARQPPVVAPRPR